MKNARSKENILWVVVGVGFMGLLVLALWRFRQDPTQHLASKARRADVVARMQLAIASASEAEKSAVLAVTDQDSQSFAERARAAIAECDRERQVLSTLLATGGTPRELELLAQFSRAFSDLRRVDDEVLSLAVQNTNVKAYSLLFGPAADALAEMDAALSRVAERWASSPEDKQVALLSFGARLGLLRIQTLLAPHIAEGGEAKMDRLEASMLEEEARVRSALAGLAAIPELKGDADLAVASSSYSRYSELKARILALSRENTNIQSLTLSLNQKRRAMILCLDAAAALKQAILDEPVAGVTYSNLPTR